MSLNDKISRKPWLGWTLFLISVVIVFFIGLLASSIIDRRAEAAVMITPKVAHSEYEPRNEVWGKNYPRQYDSYMRTSDTSFRSKHMGAAMVDMLEEDPRMVVLWAGYGFSKDYNQGRGHYYAIEDLHKTLRTGAPIDGKNSPMPNTCWTCKSPDVPRLMAEMGAAEFYKGSWDTKGHEVVNHIGCADCHDAKTMNLRISRPALVEAFERQGKNIEDATHQEMRSLTCAQCHVEYYFNKDKVEGVPYLTFPWDKGMSAEKMEEYYDNIQFVDWTHSISKAPMLKAQHPDYELYLTGIHAQRGVSCADCHMPYKSEGGEKFTDHHMQSPLNNVEASCAVCHREKTEQLVTDVYSRQDKINESRKELEILLVKAHVEAKAAWDNGATEEQMEDILQGIRRAQWRWDYVAASHGGSFHSPVESGRVLSSGIVIAQETRIKLVRLLNELGITDEIPYPPIDTKADAQLYIGLDVEKLEAEKQEFMKTVVPEWLKKAAEREKTYELTNL